MRFSALGPLEVRAPDGTLVEVGSPKVRTLLTVLLAEAGRTVPVDRIVDELWGDRPPATATGTVQTYVSHLRRLLHTDPPPVLLTRAPGYLLTADATTLDLLAFPRLVDDGGRALAAGRLDEAERALAEAVGLWRGEPLADLADRTAAVVAERARLAELGLVAREHLATARLRQGRPDAAVADLERLVGEHPLRERVWARLVEALYASGRQADALEACRTCARLLRDELGLDPGPELRDLERAVLRQDPALAPVPPVRSAAERSPGQPLPQRPANPVAKPDAPARDAPAPDAPAPEAPAPAAAPHAAEDRPLVGRRAERARIRTALADVTRGSGGVLVLEGEAGIGKTRLAEAATAMAGAQGWRVAWSRCADDAGAPALWPWTQVLAQLGADPLTAPSGQDPDRTRFALFEQLRAGLGAVAATAPLLVVLDDVQGADATSLGLLQLLAQHLDGVRLLLVVTARTVGEDLAGPVVECLTALAAAPRSQRLALTGLGEGDVRDLVETTLGGGTGATLTREVHSRTDGNPFFVVELVRLLRSEHQLDAASPPLPPSVRDVLDRRLARLPGETVELLRLAAVVGRDVDLPLLQETSGLDAERVIELLEPAVASGIVTEDDVTWQWRFSHALVQETLVAGMSRLAGARLHARVARALEARGGSRPTDLERRAHHAFHAVPVLGPEPARRYAVLAAAAARDRIAHAEAAAHTRRALSLLGAQDDPAERHRLLVALGDDLLRTGHLQGAQDAVAEALALARDLGDHDLVAEAASVWGGVTLWNWRAYGVVDDGLLRVLEDLAARAGDDDPALRARLLGTLGVELAYSDRRADGVEYAARAVEIARGLGDAALLGRALNNLSLVTWGSDDRVERRMAAADESIALSGRGLPARTEFFARLHRGPLRLHLGDVPGFVADLAAATRIGAALTGPEVRPHLLYQETGLAMLVGDWARAEGLAEEANALYQGTSMWGAQCCYALHQFTFRRREGRLGDVLDLLVDAGDLGVPVLQTTAILAAVEAGDREEGRRLRRRWPEALPQDWTTDAHLVARAWLALRTDGDLDGAYATLLPMAGRQVVVGTATATWGSYDAVLADLAHARGDVAAAGRHRADAARVGAAVGSPWQVPAAR